MAEAYRGEARRAKVAPLEQFRDLLVRRTSVEGVGRCFTTYPANLRNTTEPTERSRSYNN
ncbi:hypothetical protein DPMN_184049 [Dreissena polymorpha]|uniref:Uncharacterized protein n=1 Tax=Dreissena polymorpha TaxID=45954 RepID=A0A9D4DIS1_DREPO|nr:hypothetical protein DPMN_184049 [Dreissena polymorpha]